MESFTEQSEFLLARKKLSQKLAANWRNKNRSKKNYSGRQPPIKKLPPPLLFPPSNEPKILVHMFFLFILNFVSLHPCSIEVVGI